MRITTTKHALPVHWLSLGRTGSIVGIAAAMAGVFAIDSWTGIPHVQHLYYFPIIFAAIKFGIPSGVTTAVVSIVLYHLANPQVLGWRYEEFDIMQMAVFIAIGAVAAKSAEDARRLHTLAMTDDLTGLHNLRSFEVHLGSMVREARRDRFPISLLVIDVDRLKRVNDQHGHLAGAEAVRNVGAIIAAHVPPQAVACRYGGDEFVIAVPHFPADAALRLADDLRDAVERSAPVLAGVQFAPGAISISVGVACRGFAAEAATASDDAISEDLFRAADAALYDAKNSGRNRIALDAAQET